MAFESVMDKKIRSLLTMLGIIIGVGAVLILVSVVQGYNADLTAYYEKHSKTGQQVLDILRGLHRLGTTVILITHDNGIAAKAQRVVRLQDGHIIEDRPNTPDEGRPINANM